jgi:hypothetical protein
MRGKEAVALFQRWSRAGTVPGGYLESADRPFSRRTELAVSTWCNAAQIISSELKYFQRLLPAMCESNKVTWPQNSFAIRLDIMQDYYHEKVALVFYVSQAQKRHIRLN